MAFTITGVALTTLPTNLDSADPIEVFKATKRTTILSIVAANTDAGAATYDLIMTNGATTYRLYHTFSVSAHSREIYNEPFVVPSGWSLVAEASHANRICVFITYAEPDSTVQPSGAGAYTR